MHMEKQVLLNKLIERVNTMTDEQIAKVILDVWSNTDVASLLKQNEELKKELSWYKKYTDELVEHKDMVCLPADLKNLREANTALATENEELKKQVEEFSGQEHYSCQEQYSVDSVDIVGFKAAAKEILNDKQKSLDLLKSTGLHDSDGKLKTDKELNSVFIKEQVNPKDIDDGEDKLRMYVNPEKHVGGSKPKDIEFDGDKLVDSLKEAASKLKFFNASTGNWMTAEKLQQKPESKLKSLEEHNKQTFDAYALANNLNSGFACPKCGEELFYSNPNAALCTHPPQKSVSCNKCNYTGYVYC